MDVLLPGGNVTDLTHVYGKYKNITEKMVRVCDGVSVRYFLLKGKQRTDGADVYSILCVKYDKNNIEDSEFVFDAASTRAEAQRIFDVLCRNTVTPAVLYEVLENVIS